MARKDQRSDEAREWRRLYKSARWNRLRQSVLDTDPLCRYCLQAEIVEEAKVVDHIRQHKGDGAVGRTAILDDTMTWQAITRTMVENDFLQLRKHVAAEINRAFKIPEVLNGVTDRAVWRNVEELTTVFLEMTLTPWLDVWQAAYARCLLTPEEQGSHFIEFQVDALVRANLAARFNAYRQACGSSWMTPNEVRRLDNLPPHEGGDDLVLQAGQTPAAETPPINPIEDDNDRKEN